jgi:hypothetical protein
MMAGMMCPPIALKETFCARMKTMKGKGLLATSSTLGI